MLCMALFTLVLEFDGGTYISQFRAGTAVHAVAKYASSLLHTDSMFTAAAGRRLADALSAENPVATCDIDLQL